MPRSSLVDVSGEGVSLACADRAGGVATPVDFGDGSDGVADDRELRALLYMPFRELPRVSRQRLSRHYQHGGGIRTRR
jgi:hypothetical protein